MATDKGNQSAPTRYCLGCSYTLDWLPENRCPECGRPFDPDDPRTFARSPRKPWIAVLLSTREGRIATISVILVLLVVLMECGLDAGHRDETCALCGARSRVEHLYVYGVGGDYGRQVSEGPLSHFIQECNEARCPHAWRGYNFSGGGFFSGWLGSGNSFFFRVGRLDALPPQFADLLRAKAEADSQFARKLQVIIRGNGDETSLEYLGQLQFEGEAWCAQHPR